MNYSIIIPTCKKIVEIEDLIDKIKNTIPLGVDVIHTCYPVSASVNRNYGLMKCKTEYVIMIDDDISGFEYGWSDELVKPFELCNNVAMVSARLMNRNGTYGTMMNIQPVPEKMYQIVHKRYLPSACISFKNDGLRFDENFIGSGWEDTDFCDEVQNKYPDGMFLINNNCKLIHQNEMKNGGSKNYEINKEYYIGKRGNAWK